ncbi:hypothetical protein [Terriglobus albidus]|uniref:hypothetical protein n=1 Tax=Terriglobus albidus TaxID=1592106 RepID=UPI0021E05970|nr:hypothetical protein [Terriglobus albidus]
MIILALIYFTLNAMIALVTHIDRLYSSPKLPRARVEIGLIVMFLALGLPLTIAAFLLGLLSAMRSHVSTAALPH